jgi:hypothetical protein
MIRKSGNRFFEKIMFPSKNLDMILIEESQPSSFNDLDRQTAVSPHIAAKRLFGALANLGVPATRTPGSQHSASR